MNRGWVLRKVAAKWDGLAIMAPRMKLPLGGPRQLVFKMSVEKMHSLKSRFKAPHKCPIKSGTTARFSAHSIEGKRVTRRNPQFD